MKATIRVSTSPIAAISSRALRLAPGTTSATGSTALVREKISWLCGMPGIRWREPSSSSNRRSSSSRVSSTSSRSAPVTITSSAGPPEVPRAMEKSDSNPSSTSSRATVLVLRSLAIRLAAKISPALRLVYGFVGLLLPVDEDGSSSTYWARAWYSVGTTVMA